MISVSGEGQWTSVRNSGIIFAKGTTDKSMKTAPRTVLGDDPQLGMNREGVDDHVYILCIAFSQLRQDLDFVQYSLDALIFLNMRHLEVMRVYVNDL